jgi:4-hydroxy-tetrahydrodipicolinate synthase
VDLGAVHAHAQWLVEQGVEGICPVGTTGEFLYLAQQEKIRIVEIVVRASSGRVPVMAGVWALTAKERSFLCRSAEDAGAQAVFLPPPIYYPADDETIVQWYRDVRSTSALPVYAYNIPSYAANTVSGGALARLLEEGTIAGVKDSSGKAARLTELLSIFAEKGQVYAASDGFATEAREMGANGFISALANCWPKAFAALLSGEAELQPAVDEARTLVKSLGGIVALKHLLRYRGFSFGDARVPASLPNGMEERIKQFLQSEHGAALSR